MPELKLEPLERLDLRKCTSVGRIVLAMNQCSFGARMLGEVALKLRDWIQQGRKIRVVYDGRPLRDLLDSMRTRGWIHDIVRSDALPSSVQSGFEHLVVGRYSESADEFIHQLDGAIMINKEELSRPGQVRDGFFPDAVFADPTFILRFSAPPSRNGSTVVPPLSKIYFRNCQSIPPGKKSSKGPQRCIK